MKIKLKQAAKKKWVEALRSGKYPQGQGDLRIDDQDNANFSYCCLGVANGSSWSCGTLDSKIFASMCTKRSLGADPELAIGELQERLTCMNDVDDKSFKEIASWINKNL
jgi:hypothetical protein